MTFFTLFIVRLVQELDGKTIEQDSEEEDPLMGTEWTDFTDGYNGRLRKKVTLANGES